MSNQSIVVNAEVRTKKAKKSIEDLVKEINKAQNAVRQAGDQAGYFSRKIIQATDKVNRLAAGNREVANSAKKATGEYNKMHNVISKIGAKLKWLASVYLGVMGMGALINTSDTITSAQNRLNNLEGGNPKLTEETMNKVFAASQRARIGYTDMLANVSKTMTLAGEAFQDNIDNAILFQEIMGKTYAMGGASAAEQASSMYQMVQALGSGILQGDELRSVREGAPLAYKAIEEFAQGVYSTNESLKDLASQGKITSDIVVAAILGMENEVNQSFSQMKMTFAQAWTTIKNTAVKSFEPVFKMMSSALNSEAGKAIINGIGIALQVVAKALTTVFSLIAKVYNFVADNWGVISKIILTLGTLIGAWFVYQLSLALYTGAALTAKLILGFIAAGAAALRAGIQAFISWMTACLPLFLIIALLAAAVIAIIWVSDSFVDACGIVVGSLYWLGAVFQNIFIWMGNVAMGLWESIKAIGKNIGIAFSNAWNAAKSAFWSFVADCFSGLKKLEPAINAVAKAFGAEGFTISGVVDYATKKANSYAQKEYVSVGSAWNKGYNSYEYKDLSEAYDKGYGVGTKAGQWVTNKLDEFKEKLGLNGLGDGYDKLLGTNSYDPSGIGKGIGDTANNTGRMADAMDLAEEDLEYLRKIADMEWRKEFTTAEIKVDMSNYNTVNGDSDLDGIVTRLADKLYEELDMVANGVYA